VSRLDWYTARSAGVLAYVLLTSGVLLGTLLSGRARLRRWPAFAITDVHRFLTLLVGVFVSIHVLAVLLDGYVHFSLAQALVPGLSTYRPLWVSLGIVGVYLLLAVAITNALKKRIGFARWRRAHYLTFAIWAAVTVHGLGAGTDAGTPWLRVLYVGAIASVLAAVVWRVGRVRLPAGAYAAPSAAALVFGFALVVGLGELPAGIGTTPAASAAAAPTTLPASLSASFSGSVDQRAAGGGELISVTGSGSGDRTIALRLDFLTPDGNSITDTALQIRDVASGQVCTGTVDSIDRSGFAGSCSFPGDGARSVSGDWQIAGSSVSGSVRLSG